VLTKSRARCCNSFFILTIFLPLPVVVEFEPFNLGS
jgi:hypothetical protein